VSISTKTDSENKKVYEKHQSFDAFVSNLHSDIEIQKQRAVSSLKAFIKNQREDRWVEVLGKALIDLEKDSEEPADFKITIPVADEMAKLEDKNLPRYVFHRYRFLIVTINNPAIFRSRQDF